MLCEILKWKQINLIWFMYGKTLINYSFDRLIFANYNTINILNNQMYF